MASVSVVTVRVLMLPRRRSMGRLRIMFVRCVVLVPMV